MSLRLLARRWTGRRSAAALALLLAAACSGPAQPLPNLPFTGPQAPAACATPLTTTPWTKQVIFDLCHEQQFSHSGSNYTIRIYYTLADSPANLAQCSAAENANGVCEHKVTNAANIPAFAALLEQAIKFYRDRNLDILQSNQLLEVYVSEGYAQGVSVPAQTRDTNPRTMAVDDEEIDSKFEISRRRLAAHEPHHLVHFEYFDSDLGPIKYFFAEGNAQAMEDHFDQALDTESYALVSYVKELVENQAKRASDLFTLSYESAAWWTWLWDQYRLPGEVEPVTGWAALRDFYIEVDNDEDVAKALHDFILSRGSTFRDDFIDYTLALYAHKYDPADPRLDFLDAEISAQTPWLAGDTFINNGPPFATENVSMNPRSSRYWEFFPGTQCEYIAFTFDGHGKPYGFSLMTVDDNLLQDRWTSYAKVWARAVRSADLNRVVGVVTAVNDSGQVTVGRGCASPNLNIKSPASAAVKKVGAAGDPRKFIVRLEVLAGGSPLAGLVAGDFQVQLRKAGGGPLLPAAILAGAYVQDNYWLIVQAPDAADGAETGAFYDLIVTLGSLSDTEASAVQYLEETYDVVLVLDRSDSMNENNKIDAARKAAALLVNELADGDQAGFVVFNNVAELVSPLAQLDSGPGSHREDLESDIAAITAWEWTTIGGGMELAAGEHDANGIADNQCSFVLLSDGWETSPPGWVVVQANVVDNGCPIHVIGFGPGADEDLLQSIAGSVPGGSYDYAEASGSVPLAGLPPGPLAARLARPALAAAVSWQNNLGRVYDYKATQIAGRQRIQTWAETGHGEFAIEVDDRADKLVIALAWQTAGQGPVEPVLYDPNGAQAPALRRASSLGANEVWEVADPEPGSWMLIVESSSEEYLVSASVLSDYELYLFTGTPIAGLTQGVHVPILAALVGDTGPLTGASVTADVGAPNGQVQTLTLYDDGDHLDGEANDGVYGGLYTATAQADPETPPNPVEGQEPKVAGSYQVAAVALWNQIRREAQASFAIAPGPDEDGDGLPDDWEANHGVDDPNDDPDGDGLDNGCEFALGTDPQNSDTDGGGQSDGSEAPECSLALQDPFDPDDDLVGIVALVKATPGSNGQPNVLIEWSLPLSGSLAHVDLWRRAAPPGGQPEPWLEVATNVRGQAFEDNAVRDGYAYEYRLIPFIIPPTAGASGALQAEVMGAAVETSAVVAAADPYPPVGTILIDEGAPATPDLLVNLSLSASDSFELPPGAPSTPTEQLEMQISNSPDFAGAAWQPFAVEVENWNIGAAQPGEVVTVYARFRDEAGNVGGGPFALASILYQPGGNRLYLPIVLR